MVGKNQSIMSRITTAFSGILLTALGGFFFFQELLLPLKSGIQYGRRGRETLRAEDPVWFWLETVMKGGVLPLILVGLGLLIVIAGLKGKMKLESSGLDARPRWRKFF